MSEQKHLAGKRVEGLERGQVVSHTDRQVRVAEARALWKDSCTLGDAYFLPVWGSPYGEGMRTMVGGPRVAVEAHRTVYVGGPRCHHAA